MLQDRRKIKYFCACRFDIVRVVEDSCSVREPVIEQENLIHALKFGDSPNSYVSLNLDGNKHLKQRFNLTLTFRTSYPNGVLFQALVRFLFLYPVPNQPTLELLLINRERKGTGNA